jgi:hypothetical protein
MFAACDDLVADNDALFYLSLFVVFVSIYLAIPSSLIPFKSLRVFLQSMRAIYILFTIVFFLYLIKSYPDDNFVHQIAVATEWDSFFNMVLMCNTQ